MNYIQSLTNDFFDSLSACDISHLNLAQICEKKGIVCFESNLSSNIYGYIEESNNKTHIRINSDLPSNQKEISIASLLSMHILNISRNEEKVYINSSNLKIFNNYYNLALSILFTKKIKDRTLSLDTLNSLKNMDCNYFKLNKITEISKRTNISLPHVFNYLN